MCGVRVVSVWGASQSSSSSIFLRDDIYSGKADKTSPVASMCKLIVKHLKEMGLLGEVCLYF